MNPSRIFILRPVATSLLMLAILLSGVLAYRFLPLAALPQVDYPTIQIQTFYPGASPDVMSTSVTAPLEVQLGQMPGLMQMSSSSAAGASVITLQFSLSLNIDVAEQEVQAAINAAGNLLPADLPAPPIYAKVNPADAPIMTLALTSRTMPLTQVEDLADTRLAQKISQVAGVGLVSLSGGQRPAVRIAADLRKLAAYGLNIDDLRTTIANANVDTPKGNFDGPQRSYTVNANDQLRSADEYRSLVVAYHNGAAIRLTDVARVTDGAQNEKLAAWSGSEPAVILNIQRQPGANVIAVVDAIKAMMPQLEATLPPAIDIKVLSDRTTTIRASVADVQFELAVSIGLVVLVIFLFLRNLPATVIPALSVPLSIVGTFGVMYLCGFSINNLSLMALTIATGFVVDDAIVMIENIARYLEEGESARDAALKGARQIGFTIVSLTVSLIAVLIPLLFMRDVVGRLFREFAITLAVTILISALVSLTLVPMLCARLLKARAPGAEPRHDAATGWFGFVLRWYEGSLDWVLLRRGAVLFVAGVTLVVTVALYAWVPKGLFPVQDTGLIQAMSQAPESVSFAEMARRQQALAAVILKDADVQGLSSFIGVDGSNLTLNTGRLLITLKPHGVRSSTVSEVIRRLNGSAASVPGVRLFMQPVQDLTIDTTASRTQYSFVLEDADPAEIGRWVPNLLEKLASVPQIEDVGSDLEQQGLATYVTIDRATAARFGITPATIDNALYDAYGQRIVSTIFTQSNQYRVILEADPLLQTRPEDLSQVYLPSSTAASGSGQVPLSAISTFSERRMPLLINHLGQFPSAVVSFNLARGASLGTAVEGIGDALRKAGQPASVFVVFQGAAQAFQQALSNEIYLLLAAIVTVYIVLGVLYESYVHPLTILSTLPSAGIGALLALRLAGSDLDIIGIIGIVLLIGIVKKNAIMMIDFALEAERERGLPAIEAIREACLLRLRPILMTTFAAVFGALPLMLGTGVGSELRHPLGLTIVGGLILSQVLTLYTTPVIYLGFDWLARRISGRRASGPARAES